MRRAIQMKPDFRKLAAIDIAFLGYRFILAEYAFAVVFSIALGILVLARSHSVWQVALGTYLVCLGINYVPMLVHTVSINNKQNAMAEMGDELNDKRTAMSKYRRVSLLLLVPLAVPFFTMIRRRS
jgi:hypothetical protein